MTMEFAHPVTTDLVAQWESYLQANLAALSKFLEGETLAGTVPTNAKRYNATSDLFEFFNGSAWAEMPLAYVKTSTYTAADVLAKLLTVDGSTSGLDADALDGQDGAYYANITARLGYTPINKAGDSGIGALSMSACTVGGAPVWTSGNDGPGTGLDADLLDGADGTAYHDAAQLTGTVPSARLSGGYTGITQVGTLAGLTMTGNLGANAGSTLARVYAFEGGDSSFMQWKNNSRGTDAKNWVWVWDAAGAIELKAFNDALSVGASALRVERNAGAVTGVILPTLNVTGRTFNTNITLQRSDAGATLIHTDQVTGHSVTIPPNSSVPFPIGTWIDVVAYNPAGGSPIISLVRGSGVLLYLVGDAGTTNKNWDVSGAQISFRLRKWFTDHWYVEPHAAGISIT